MAMALIDWVGLGNNRAVANAAQDERRQRTEDRIIAELVAALDRRDVATEARRAPRADNADVAHTAA